MPDLIAADRVGASACVVSAMTIAVFKPEALSERSSVGKSSWLLTSVSKVRVLPFRFAWFRDLHPDIPGSMKGILERGCLFVVLILTKKNMCSIV